VGSSWQCPRVHRHTETIASEEETAISVESLIQVGNRSDVSRRWPLILLHKPGQANKEVELPLRDSGDRIICA
jgi:hypothetical protein